VVVGYAASVLLAVGMGWGLHRATTGAIASAVSVSHTLQILEAIRGVEASLARSESAQRGYLLSGQDKFLDERDREMANARVHAATVATLTRDNSSQQQEVNALHELLRQRLERMRESARSRRALSDGSLVVRMPALAGHQISVRAYELTERMRQTELGFLTLRGNEETRQFRLIEYGLAGTLLVFLALVVPGWVISFRAARARASAERSMVQLAESLPGAVFQYRVFKDGTTCYELLSSATERIRGVDRDAAMRDPKVLLDTILEPDRTHLFGKLAAYQATMTPIVVDYRARVRDQVRWIRTVAAPRSGRDGSVVWSGHWDDVTTRRELEEQLRESKEEADAANRAKSTFLATMSHEIRTPMNGVLGMLELLSLSTLDGEQRSTLGIVRESGRSLLRIIDDILDFSKVEAGKLDLVPEPMSVRDVIQRVWSMYSGTASSKGLLLKRFFDERIAPLHIADPVRLQQILGNFVSNALKFTNAGGASVSAHLLESNGSRETVQFTVSDSGVGISSEQQARLFQPFTQVHDPLAQRAGGTGLGLSISQRLAALMGGKISVESEPDKGTHMTLTVELPIAEEGETAPSQPSMPSAGAIDVRPPPSVEDAERSGRLLLIVDDHPVNRIVLVRQVNALGYATETAEDGADALAKWTMRRFAGIVTDCNMPSISGYELVTRIRALEREARLPRTVVIACTANALGGEAEKCLAAGMDDYLPKPVALDQLYAKLQQWLPHQTAAASTASPPTHADAPLDAAIVEEITGNDDALARELLTRFRHHNDEDVRNLREALAHRDAARLASFAHRMKGSSRTIGAVSLARVCEEIERLALAHDIDGAANHLPRLEGEMDRLYAHIRDKTMSAA
jgi:signal transduction histidine kinase/CHASE3 domain sensor protein/DNA-binding response OmpR family regulator